MDELPVVVIGAGPSGLAAAAHLIDRGLQPIVVEAGPSAGTSVRQWHHVRLFSRWGELIDAAGGEAAGADRLGGARTRTGTRPGRSGRSATCSRWPTRWATVSASAPGSSASPDGVVTCGRRGPRPGAAGRARDHRPRRGADHRARGGGRVRDLDAAEPAGRQTGCRRSGSGPRRTGSRTGCRTWTTRRCGPGTRASALLSRAVGTRR